MDHHDGLMLGMFWGGVLVASVPILLTLGIGILVYLRWREANGHQDTGAAEPSLPGSASPGDGP